MFAISIGLERDGEIVAGLIHNPASGETFTAERGKGAYLNDRRIRIAGRTTMDDCVIATGIPHRGKSDHAQFLSECEMVMSRSAGLRRMGAASLDLAWVAAGRFDGFWERNLQAWDLAAGVILIKEAGGYVTGLGGKPDMLETGGIVAGNEQIHRALRGVLTQCAKAA
jgi:myo-inositol-1(or 4)-monophosphatase